MTRNVVCILQKQHQAAALEFGGGGATIMFSRG